jgi:hypothetical protein
LGRSVEKTMMRLILLPLMLLCFAVRVEAQQAYILTVGVDYEAQKAGTQDLYALDAQDMKALLEKKSAFSVAAADCLGGKKAKLSACLDKLGSIKKEATEKDVVLLYFSVHGETTKKGKFSMDLADKPITGKVLVKEFDEIKANIVLLLDTCGAGGMLNYASTNPRVCVMAGCKATEETSGDDRNPLHGYYSNAIHAVVSSVGKNGLTLSEIDRYLLDPSHVLDSDHQHAVSSLPQEMRWLNLFKR